MPRFCVLVALLLMASCGQESEPVQPASDERLQTAESVEQQASTGADMRAALAAESALPQPVTEQTLLSCEPMHGMTPYCGFQNPEDLVQIPGTELLIVSEMGEFMMDSPGALSLLDMAAGQRQTLTIDWSLAGESWGDSDCQAPDTNAFSPHGIDLVVRDDGTPSLLVVNHGGRESVEFFAVAESGDLAWRGCALPPEDPFINDVAARRDGGFYVTHMWNKSDRFEDTAAKLLAGEATGWVWAWSPTDGFSRLPNTLDQMPNGIAINADDTVVYVNVYMGSRTFALDLASNERTAEQAVRQPDNVSVDTDGAVWIASHHHDPVGQTCTEVTAGPCLLPFQVIKADPLTLQPEVIIDHDGPPMGYATVALKAGNRVYLGSAHGDRIVSVEL